jgi:hypothetical protein
MKIGGGVNKIQFDYISALFAAETLLHTAIYFQKLGGELQEHGGEL